MRLHPPELPGVFAALVYTVHLPQRVPGFQVLDRARLLRLAAEPGRGGPLAHVALFLFGLSNETCAKAGERWLGHKLSSGNKEEVPKLGAPWQGRRPPTAHPGSRSPSACSRPGRRPSCGSCCRGATGPLWSSAGTGTAGVRLLPHPLSTLAGGGADRDLDHHQGRVSALNPPSLPVYLTPGPCPPVLGV